MIIIPNMYAFQWNYDNNTQYVRISVELHDDNNTQYVRFLVKLSGDKK